MNIQLIQAMKMLKHEPLEHSSANQRYTDLVRQAERAQKQAIKQRDSAIVLGCIMTFFAYTVGILDHQEAVGETAREVVRIAAHGTTQTLR